jgi:hypothetical protein
MNTECYHKLMVFNTEKHLMMGGFKMKLKYTMLINHTMRMHMVNTIHTEQCNGRLLPSIPFSLILACHLSLHFKQMLSRGCLIIILTLFISPIQTAKYS